MKYALMAATLFVTLGSCDDPMTATEVDDGLSGTQDQFSMMTGPCVAQAARMTGAEQGSIVVTDQIRTGGGPLLTLDADGTPYSCRLEDDGSVTVFSEFAN